MLLPDREACYCLLLGHREACYCLLLDLVTPACYCLPAGGLGPPSHACLLLPAGDLA